MLRCVLVLVFMSISVSSHRCVHSSLHYLSLPTTRIYQETSTFRPIRIVVNYALVDVPQNDFFRPSNSQEQNLQVCLTEGQKVILGDITTSDIPCRGAIRKLRNCYILCSADDLFTARKVELLKGFVEAQRQEFISLLQVANLDDNTINIRSQCLNSINYANQSLDTDFVLIPTLRPTIDPNTLALAGPCALHPITHRPIVAHLNVAPSTIVSNPDMKTVIRHELIHGLGFSPDLFQFFRHPSNRSLTYREYNPLLYPTGPIRGDGIVESAQGITINASALGAGKKLYFVGPNVLAFAKTYFNCSTIDGVELENDGGAASAGAHWETRLIYLELMTATQKVTPGLLTGFTISLLRDSGFYEVSVNNEEESDWGRNEGCSFVLDRCDQSSWSKYFCSRKNTAMCGYNRKFMAVCNLASFTTSLPTPYQYFPSEPQDGGLLEFIDRCPFAAPSVSGDCFSSQSDVVQATNGGNGSRCFYSSILQQGYTSQSQSVPAICLKTACDTFGNVHVRVGRSFYQCVRGATVELVFPPRSTLRKPPVTTQNIVSWMYYGVIQCPQLVDCHSADIHTISSWPTISSIFPSSVNLRSTTSVTIAGTFLNFCSMIRIGGVNSTAWLSISPFVAEVTMPAVPTSIEFGGPGAGGVGEVGADLYCNLNCCPEGCFVHHLSRAANYSTSISAAPPPSFDFINDDSGKIILAAVGLCGLLIVFCLLYRCCKKDPVKERENLKKRHKQRRGNSPQGKPRRLDDMMGDTFI